MSEEKSLPQKFGKNGFNYRLVERNSYAAIYSQHDKKDDKIVAYEVFETRKTKPNTATIAGQKVHFKGREKIPADEDFGKWAYSIATFKKAKEKYRVITLKKRIATAIKELT